MKLTKKTKAKVAIAVKKLKNGNKFGNNTIKTNSRD